MQFLSAYISPKRSLGTKPAVLTVHFPAQKNRVSGRFHLLRLGNKTLRQKCHTHLLRTPPRRVPVLLFSAWRASASWLWCPQTKRGRNSTYSRCRFALVTSSRGGCGVYAPRPFLFTSGHLRPHRDLEGGGSSRCNESFAPPYLTAGVGVGAPAEPCDVAWVTPLSASACPAARA